MASNTTWGDIISRYNEIANRFQYVSSAGIASAFGNAANSIANNPTIQNSRIKAIATLPVDYTKEEIGAFLQDAYGHERELRATASTIKNTIYPFNKIIKTYQDIGTYRYYAQPTYLADISDKDFIRECKIIDKFNRAIGIKSAAHKITGQCMAHGKVFYIARYAVDKAHNNVEYAFLQQLPQDYCRIVGFNNISGYTISFDLMYFMKPGTDYRQYGDLFTRYMDDFAGAFDDKTKKYIYASRKSVAPKYKFDPRSVKANAIGSPSIYMQNGRWMYYVTLPIDKVWTFDIDDTSPAVISPLSGMFLTYAQQADYEAAQLSLIIQPLAMIFTGEIPYSNDSPSKEDDGYRLSLGGRELFQTYWDALMSVNNTGGVALYSAPLANIKSHSFSESANANGISKSFNEYAGSKAGLNALIPTTDDIKASQVDASKSIESEYATKTIYQQIDRMMTHIYGTLNFRNEWIFHMFGTIFGEKEIRDNAMKMLAIGDISAWFKLAALDDQSFTEKITMIQAIKKSNIMDMLDIPRTAYTQSGNNDNVGGRPKNEKITDSTEHSEDAGVIKGE